MAATVTVDSDIPVGQTKHLYELSIALDSSYPTGGEALDASANVRFSTLVATPNSGYVFEFDEENQKLKAFYADNNNAADGPLIEVPDTTNLAALTDINAIAIGA